MTFFIFPVRIIFLASPELTRFSPKYVYAAAVARPPMSMNGRTILLYVHILLPVQFMICVSDHELLIPFGSLSFIRVLLTFSSPLGTCAICFNLNLRPFVFVILRKYGKFFSKYFHLSEVLFDGGVYLCTSPHTTFFTNSRRSLGSVGPIGVPNVSCIIAIKASM